MNWPEIQTSLLIRRKRESDIGGMPTVCPDLCKSLFAGVFQHFIYMLVEFRVQEGFSCFLGTHVAVRTPSGNTAIVVRMRVSVCSKEHLKFTLPFCFFTLLFCFFTLLLSFQLFCLAAFMFGRRMCGLDGVSFLQGRQNQEQDNRDYDQPKCHFDFPSHTARHPGARFWNLENHKPTRYPFANICLIPRRAWRVRSSFSIRLNLTWASP